MTYTWKLSSQFQCEFSNFPVDQQDKIIEFTDVYETYGLSDFTKYEGKITSSWSGSDMSKSDYEFAKDNHLWHYHIGIPHYTQVHGKYKTSDWVLHFQWPNKGNIIALVDLYVHYKGDGSFYLPPKKNLDSE